MSYKDFIMTSIIGSMIFILFCIFLTSFIVRNIGINGLCIGLVICNINLLINGYILYLINKKNKYMDSDDLI